ncbi:hypothetical protein CVT25_000446 [Psilocybe cyanescens]|uniref:Uncharacterized protein n=1 Tax=Psilocybe cyanescens TaxID=93625 RepID=A0A409XM27_PSICY|nr:hypothetical protein CVT25_000446 [Psilocybe cyanescens]
MSATRRTLSSIALVSREQSKHGVVMIVSSNLSFPSRHYTQVPWCGPIAPLVATKQENVRYKTNVVHTNDSGNNVLESSLDGFHVGFETNIWTRFKDFLSHTKLKLRENFVRLRERITRNAHLPLPGATHFSS